MKNLKNSLWLLLSCLGVAFLCVISFLPNRTSRSAQVPTPALFCQIVCVSVTPPDPLPTIGGPSPTRTTVSLPSPTIAPTRTMHDVFRTATDIAKTVEARGTPATPTQEILATAGVFPTLTPVRSSTPAGIEKIWSFTVIERAGLKAYICPSMESFSSACNARASGLAYGSVVVVPAFGDACEIDSRGYYRVKVFDSKASQTIWIAWKHATTGERLAQVNGGSETEFVAEKCQ